MITELQASRSIGDAFNKVWFSLHGHTQEPSHFWMTKGSGVLILAGLMVTSTLH
jgi:hypothetical protein